MHLTTQTYSTQNSFKKPSNVLMSLGGALLIAALINLSGCAHAKSKVSNVGNSATQSSNIGEKPLSAEFVYRYLVAEVAGQRGEIGTSGAIFYELAKTERDARLAERAAKLAAYGNISNLTIPAIRLWAELDPTSNEAQQAMTEVLIATNKLSETQPYLAKLFEKEDSRANGFLYVNNLLSRSTDKAGVLKLVQSLAKPYPKLPEAHFAIAQAALGANQDDLALASLNKAEALRPEWAMAILLKGQVLYKKSPQAAINYYGDFLKAHPENNEIRINLAKILVSQKRYDEAKNEYPVILERAQNGPNKNTADVSALIGLLSFQSTDYIAAERYFQQALDAGFKDADQIYLYLGQTAEKLKHDDAAFTWYNKVPQGTHYLEAQLNLANVLARTKSVNDAIELLDSLEGLNTEQQIIVIQSQASLLSKDKRDQDSFDLLENAVKNLPNTPELVYDYALAAERIQKFEIMESELRKVIAAKPDFAAAYNALGYSFADRNIKLNEAIGLIEKALALSPNDHYMLDSLGWAHYRKGNLDKALKYLQEAYDINPDPEIAAHLGEVLWHKGEHEKAQKIWHDALTANPDNEVLVLTANKFKS